MTSWYTPIRTNIHSRPRARSTTLTQALLRMRNPRQQRSQTPKNPKTVPTSSTKAARSTQSRTSASRATAHAISKSWPMRLAQRSSLSVCGHSTSISRG